MPKAEHTPGPWRFDRDSNVLEMAGKPTADIVDVSPPLASYEEARANGHLIAAAPELLAACQSMLVKFLSKEPQYKQAIAAIDKAMGIRE